ncbi:MAG: hypothetical protein HC880_00605 [Bacteroidia bacterium]|nr:hypothetical protein [Bacteroidia bacterium]
MESTLASDLLEACKVLEVKDLTYEEIEKVLEYTKKKVTDPKGYMDDLQKLKRSQLTKGLSTRIEDFRAKYKIPGDLQTIASSKGTLTINGKSVIIEKIGASPAPKKYVTDNTIMPQQTNQRYINRYKSDNSILNHKQRVNHAEQDKFRTSSGYDR